MKEITIQNIKFRFETYNSMKGLKYLFIKDLINDETNSDILHIDDVIELRDFLNDVIKDF